VIIIYILFFVEKDIQEFVINTLQFTNESSIGHLVEWLAGLEAMVNNPLGLGLGSSGRISALQGTNVGGENQFIIIGVQTGFIGMLIYLAIYISTVVQSIQWYPKLRGKEQKIALVVILAKLGLFIPLFTTNLEAYIYVSYLLWIFNGLFVQVMEKQTNLAA
jgi:O-antigen ligase